jgi:riboflavin synthase
MFTGIIQDIGIVVDRRPSGDGLRLKLRSKLTEKMSVDDSVAINGVCQTVVSLSGDYFEVDAVAETLKKTNFSNLSNGDQVHLELAATPTTFLGGHLVQGHVNGVGRVTQIVKKNNNSEVYIGLDPILFRYIVKEGSITVDGVSLTVADVFRERSEIKISLIPHTSSVTCLLKRPLNYEFNIEVDVLAKYVENILLYNQSGQQDQNKNVQMSYEWLHSKGF